MNEVAMLEYSLDELSRVVAALDDAEMDTVTNCAPWTVRQLASHALNNQLLWAGMVTGEELVSAEVTMGAVAYDRTSRSSRTTSPDARWHCGKPTECCRRHTSPRLASSPVRS
jgi:hypothetical protein